MKTLPFLSRCLVLCLLFVATAPVSAADRPAPFTATYRVLQAGQTIGEATITLKAVGADVWEYSNQSRGTAGLAAAMGASSSETTRLRWRGAMPETVSYDYRMDAAIKSKHRHTDVDWKAQKVSVDDGKGPMNYPSAPGLVDRNLLPFALGLALRAGQKDITLPVAVKREVEQQHYRVTGEEDVSVPAGHFKALRLERVDTDRAYVAWYVPARYPVPVRLSQKGDGDLELQLQGYRQP
ncbi:DUF3108 domain-containing protein [Aerosticca soli]|uniref:DUF3108 domain-containing protein n=1 Tax=Aerosticca soli TaxID=2010829 RepID=UPI000F826D14|nr:DUF3108 domain-containing protein [Aerosticca soli]MDI3262034.1 DUF3108 domain-containing protein [Fulvimonas sp.]